MLRFIDKVCFFFVCVSHDVLRDDLPTATNNVMITSDLFPFPSPTRFVFIHGFGAIFFFHFNFRLLKFFQKSLEKIRLRLMKKYQFSLIFFLQTVLWKTTWQCESTALIYFSILIGSNWYVLRQLIFEIFVIHLKKKYEEFKNGHFRVVFFFLHFERVWFLVMMTYATNKWKGAKTDHRTLIITFRKGTKIWTGNKQHDFRFFKSIYANNKNNLIWIKINKWFYASFRWSNRIYGFLWVAKTKKNKSIRNVEESSLFSLQIDRFSIIFYSGIWFTLELHVLERLSCAKICLR